MDNFIAFVTNNFIWFLVISIFLIFALIGYIYDMKKEKNNYLKNETVGSSVEPENIVIPENKSINDMLSANKTDEKEENVTSEIINNN